MKINSNNFFYRGSPRHPNVFSLDFLGGSPVRTVHHTHGRRIVFLYCVYIGVQEVRNFEHAMGWKCCSAFVYCPN